MSKVRSTFKVGRKLSISHFEVNKREILSSWMLNFVKKDFRFTVYCISVLGRYDILSFLVEIFDNSMFDYSLFETKENFSQLLDFLIESRIPLNLEKVCMSCLEKDNNEMLFHIFRKYDMKERVHFMKYIIDFSVYNLRKEFLYFLSSEICFDMNFRDWDGKNLLHIQITKSVVSVEHIRLLLSIGVDPKATDNFGKTPVDNLKYVYMMEKDKEDIRCLIEDHCREEEIKEPDVC